MSEAKKEVTLTVRMTADEKREADASASYLGLPLSTFLRFAARRVFNDERQKMIEAGAWQDDDAPTPGTVIPRISPLASSKERRRTDVE